VITRLAIGNLSFSYRSAEVLRDFRLEVGFGQIVSIVGPNGSGKSTLIKCIDRILVPASGTICVDRRNVLKMDRMQTARMIAYVPQNSVRVFPNTVFDVVLMGRRPHLGWRAEETDEKKVWEALKMLAVEELALNPFGELSGGQQQKVLIARALAQETGVVLLDEPTSSLDMWHKIDVMEVLRSLVKKRDITAIIAIHDLNVAARYSNTVIMMKNGRIVASGKPDAVITEENLKTVYGIRANVKFSGEVPYVIPLERIAREGMRP
jgi:iron complex transport system ATP-binding protein